MSSAVGLTDIVGEGENLFGIAVVILIRGFVQKAVTDKFGTYLEEHPSETRELIMRCVTAQTVEKR